MPSINWLHLSDWHQDHRGVLDRGTVRDALIEDLRARKIRCHPELENLDFIVFSGDLAFRGLEAEYERARMEFLEPLLEATGVSRDRLFLVPGNHDVDRSRLTYLPDLLRHFGQRETVAEAFQQTEIRSHLLFPLKAYTQFVARFFKDPDPDPTGYGYLKSFDVKGQKIAVLGLNSAWMCGQFQDPYKERDKVNDYGRLILGEHQFRQHLGKLENADIRIAVMHHPFHWFSEVEQRSRLENDLISRCHFILRGHEHTSAVSVPIGTAGNCAVISAGAAYDRREYPNGYNYVLMDLERGQGTVFLRRYSDERRIFIKDAETTGDNSPGLITFSLPKNLSDTAKSSLQHEPAAARIIGNPWSLQNPATMQALGEIYKRQHEDSPFVYKLARLVVKANSLCKNPSPDEITTIVEFQAKDKPVYCHKVSLLRSEGSEYLGQANWSVRCSTGDPIQAIELPIIYSPDSTFRQLVLFFDPVLEPGPVSYIVEVKELLTESLKPLTQRGRDELFLRPARASGDLERVDLVVLVPQDFGTVELRPSSRRGTAGVGRLMTAEELKTMPAATDFYTLGWTGSKLIKNTIFAADLIKVGL